MGCPPVRGNNPRALASGLSYVQVNKHGIIYTTYISVDLAHHEVFHAKVGKGGINCANFPIMQRIDEQVWNQSKHYMFFSPLY